MGRDWDASGPEPCARYRRPVSTTPEAVASAWGGVVYDCGCPDMYYCPTGGEVECPRHSGFAVCCDRPEGHLPVPDELRATVPHPPLPPGETAKA